MPKPTLDFRNRERVELAHQRPTPADAIYPEAPQNQQPLDEWGYGDARPVPTSEAS